MPSWRETQKLNFSRITMPTFSFRSPCITPEITCLAPIFTRLRPTILCLALRRNKAVYQIRQPAHIRHILNPNQPRQRKPDPMPGIECPGCRMHPDMSELWRCSCGYTWNTFKTGGQCPGCSKRWENTQCPSCHQWSPHPDWYTEAGNLINGLLPNEDS